MRLIVVACTQGRISYNLGLQITAARRVVACTQGRISYNEKVKNESIDVLWLALRGGSVTILF